MEDPDEMLRRKTGRHHIAEPECGVMQSQYDGAIQNRERTAKQDKDDTMNREPEQQQANPDKHRKKTGQNRQEESIFMQAHSFLFQREPATL